MWQIIKDKVNNIPSCCKSNTIKSEDEIITNPQKVAEKFNNYFISISNDAAPLTKFNKYMNNIQVVNSSIFLKPVSIVEVLKTIQTLNNTKSVGFDGVSTLVTKQIGTLICSVLTHILNLSLSEGVFPDILKLSVVKPLHKKGDREDLNNYRPITLISVFAKIFERIMHNRLTCFF